MRLFSSLWYNFFMLYSPKNIKINFNSEIKNMFGNIYIRTQEHIGLFLY